MLLAIMCIPNAIFFISHSAVLEFESLLSCLIYTFMYYRALNFLQLYRTFSTKTVELGLLS